MKMIFPKKPHRGSLFVDIDGLVPPEAPSERPVTGIHRPPLRGLMEMFYVSSYKQAAPPELDGNVLCLILQTGRSSGA